MSEELSHAGMFNCFFCNKPMGVLLDKRLKKTLPRNVGCIDREPCNACKTLMKLGILCIEVDESKTNDRTNPYRTGRQVVLKEKSLRRFVTSQSMAEEICKHRVCFIPQDAWEKIGLNQITPKEPTNA